MIKVKDGKVKVQSHGLTDLLVDLSCIVAGIKDTIMNETDLCRGEVETIIKSAVDVGIHVRKE